VHRLTRQLEAKPTAKSRPSHGRRLHTGDGVAAYRRGAIVEPVFGYLKDITGCLDFSPAATPTSPDEVNLASDLHLRRLFIHTAGVGTPHTTTAPIKPQPPSPQQSNPRSPSNHDSRTNDAARA
jgi:hypothetical protein